MNFGHGNADGLKKQQPTYFVAPNFTTRPFPDGPLDLGTLVADLETCYPINQGSSPSSRVPIPEGQRYADSKGDVRAAVKASAGAEASVLARVLDRSVGGDASLKGQRSDEDVYTLRALDTEYFYPTPGYIRQCLRLRDVREYSEMADHKAPVYLITGLKIARGATVATDRSRELEGNAEAGIQVPVEPVDVQVKASAGVSKGSGVVSSFGEPADFVLAVQAQKIYYKRRFGFGEPTLATKRVVKNAVLVDDDDVPVEEDDAETDFDFADLDGEEVQNLVSLDV